jgi:hypothetical protein
MSSIRSQAAAGPPRDSAGARLIASRGTPPATFPARETAPAPPPPASFLAETKREMSPRIVSPRLLTNIRPRRFASLTPRRPRAISAITSPFTNRVSRTRGSRPTTKATPEPSRQTLLISLGARAMSRRRRAAAGIPPPRFCLLDPICERAAGSAAPPKSPAESRRRWRQLITFARGGGASAKSAGELPSGAALAPARAMEIFSAFAVQGRAGAVGRRRGLRRFQWARARFFPDASGPLPGLAPVGPGPCCPRQKRHNW